MKLFTSKEEEYLTKQKICAIATQQKDGELHVVPIRLHYNGKHMYVATHEKRKKIENMRDNGKVALLIGEFRSGTGSAEGVMVQGKVDMLPKGEEYLKAGEAIGLKRTGFNPKTKLWMYGPYKQFVLRISPKRKASWGINHPYRGGDQYSKTGVVD